MAWVLKRLALPHLACGWLTGPMFDKELRVASRQRRYYLLRFGYVALLTLFIAYVWLAVARVGSKGPAVVRVSRMPEAGKYIVTCVVWLQFIAGSFLTVVLLSGSISSEVRQRTLDALLVTPISGVQIVLGKMLSKMLQPILLLAVSLPLLTVVRVFGGVPWAYVTSGLCITLSTMVFVGFLSVLLSVTNRQAHHVATTVVGWCLILWGGVPLLLTALSAAGYINAATVQAVLRTTNPFAVLLTQTLAMLAASTAPAAVSWRFHCLILLAAAAMVSIIAVWRVRRAALVSILARAGGRHASRSKARPEAGRRRARTHTRAWTPIRRVKGAPIVWKELCRPLFPTRLRAVLAVGVSIVALAVMAVALVLARERVGFAFFVLAQTLQLLFFVRLAASAASAITREKEARTWPILLMTPLDNREIVRGKVVGVFRWNLCLLIPLCVLYLLGYVLSPPIAGNLIHLAVSLGSLVFGLTGSILFLLGLGLYLSVRLKTTVAAVASTLGLYIAPKLFCCGGLSPLLFWSVRTAGPPGTQGPLGMLLVPLLFTVGVATVYGALGWLFVRAATGRLRRNVFA
ncbi:MAG: ABC transporter permease subunit [Sedimentisphaerales bacterium]|nr:ABC transporter permease subunit [Sedimentisphaerales bacterium]